MRICISQTGISSWNSNTSLPKNRPWCWLLSFPFRPVLNTQTSMLMGNPWGAATFVPALRGCLSLGTGWQPPDCLLLDNQHVARYWSPSSRGMPAGRQHLIGIWLASVLISFIVFCLSVMNQEEVCYVSQWVVSESIMQQVVRWRESAGSGARSIHQLSKHKYIFRNK